MCGFLGRINGEEQGISMENSLSFLSRRGPDAYSLWSSLGKKVELVHARLAIVDPDENATQPFSDAAKKVTIAFNGEVYNFKELRSQLSDYSFRTKSDTEVLLALYLKRGIEGFKDARGMFSAVIVDSNTREVILFRDPVGKKPLFVAQWGREVLFGSSVLALRTISKQPGGLEAGVLDHYWENGRVNASKTAFENCLPVMPGQVLIFNFEGMKLRELNCFPREVKETFNSQEEVFERAGQLLKLSVERRLQENPSKVILLSGGVDSTVVAEYMRQQTNLKSLTLGNFIPLDLDEKYARYAARKMQIPLEVLRIKTSRFEENISWALDLQDEPLVDLAFIPLALLMKAAKAFGKIILTGDGGDEVFFGYGKPEDWRSPDPQDQSVKGVEVGPPLPSWISDWGRQAITEDLLANNFVKSDRASAEQGIEIRSPLLDWDLMVFARSLSYQQLFFSKTSKSILKEQLKAWPRLFVERKKIGFGYRLRWAWGFHGFRGLRELISLESHSTFLSKLPYSLRKSPSTWKSLDIFSNFSAVWRLLVWSQFLARIQKSNSLSRKALPVAA